MDIRAIASIVIPLLIMWGALWYRLGRLVSDVKHHNVMLAEVQKQLERIITGGDSDGRQD